MKPECEDVVVVKHVYSTTVKGYLPVTYEIEVGDRSLDMMSEKAAKCVYEELGKLLYPGNKEGGPNA